MNKRLLLMDTDSIKNYVFGTNKLRDIRGASAILDDLNRIRMPQIVESKAKGNSEKIFSNGGVGEFIVPAGTESEIIHVVSQEYIENGASVSCCSIPLPEDFDMTSTDSEPLIEQLAYKMQFEKDRNKTETSISSPFFRACDICHLENASKRDEADVSKYVCNRCASKRKKFKKIKDDTPGYFKKLNPLSDDSMRCKLIKHLKKLENENKLCFLLGEDLTFPDEIEDVNELENEYIALIYADGNNMRKEIVKRKLFEERKEFSDKVDDTIFSALAHAINNSLHPYVNKRHEYSQKMFPFDVLLLGGDDLIIVCQARKALNVAIDICKKFYKDTDGLSLSVGVAFAHPKFPIRMLLGIAENLLKVAKKERSTIMRHLKMNALRKDEDLDPFLKGRIPEFEEGAINFMTVSSSSSLLYEDYFKNSLYNDSKNEKFIKTFRPYSPVQLRKLLDIGSELKKTFPKSKLEYLSEALFTNKFNSMLKSLFIFTRAKKQQKETLRKVFNFYPELSPVYPWQVQSGEDKIYRTPILDILEIYRFLGD